MLQILGLSAAAESVYAELVSRPDPDVAAAAALRADDPAPVLSELELKGLIAERAGAPGHYAVTPPAVALEALIDAQRHALRRAEAAAAEMAEAYRLGCATGRVADLVEVVTGRAAIRQRFRQIRRGASREVLALVTAGLFALDDPHTGSAGPAGSADAAGHPGSDEPAPSTSAGQTADAAGPRDPAEPEDDAPDPTIRFRVVLERGVLDTPGAAIRIARVLGRREQVRVANRLPAQLVVADRTRALVPLTASAALVVNAPTLVDVLVCAFDAVWQHAQPVRLDASGPAVAVVPAVPVAGEPDALDLRVLALLLIGSTDATVANQLGLGLRTVQRRIRRLMELAGVETRIQLGWQARERGWVRGSGL